MYKILLTVFSFTLLAGACKDKEDQAEIDDMILQEYLTSNGIDAVQVEETGVFYIIDSLGTGGEFATASSTVRVYYKGYLLDGTVFDTNYGGDWKDFPLFQMIGGWRLGIPYFEKGSKGRLFIPSRYAYGSTGTPNIPPDSVVAFEVEILNIF